ncbi:MAG: hypothetical protein IJX55_05260 [Clostridia bacterium]|nr:hypothetical protein [Clostridia bacterium]
MNIKQEIEERYRNLLYIKPDTTKEEYEKNRTEYLKLLSNFSKKEKEEILFEIIKKIQKEQKIIAHTEQDARCAEILKMIEDILLNNILDIEKNEAKVVRREYASGGECIYRGFYCPSKIADIVVGNVKRGRILKRVKGSKPNYCYGFDENDRIISVKKIFGKFDDEYEFIYYKCNEEIGVNFRRNAMSVAICKFENDKMISYELFQYDGFNKNISEYLKETYKYSAESMVVMWERYYPAVNSFSSTTYYFSVKDGYLSNYLADGVREYIVNPKIKRKF